MLSVMHPPSPPTLPHTIQRPEPWGVRFCTICAFAFSVPKILEDGAESHLCATGLVRKGIAQRKGQKGGGAR